MILNGSTTDLRPDLVGPLSEVIGSVADLAVAHGLTVLTGATDAGIFSILGAAMDDRSAPLVGVAPAGLVDRPGAAPAGEHGTNRQSLESHHSHFVLVDGDQWGVETPALLALADALGARAPSAAVLCGGGDGARTEVLGHGRAGRPIVVIAGSGRFADALAAAAAQPDDRRDPDMAEIIGRSAVVVCRIEDGPPAITAALRAALGLTGPK